MSDLSPSDGLGDFDAGESATDAGTGAADAADQESSSGGTSLKDLLLSTEPDMDVGETKRRLDVGNTGAHLYIAVRKMIGAVSSTARSAGTTALEHLGLAGISFATDAGDGGGDQDGDPGGAAVAGDGLSPERGEA